MTLACLRGPSCPPRVDDTRASADGWRVAIVDMRDRGASPTTDEDWRR